MPCMIIMYHKSSTIAKAPCHACVHIANGTNIACSTHIPHLHRSRAPTQEFMPAWTRQVPSSTLTRCIKPLPLPHNLLVPLSPLAPAAATTASSVAPVF